ncbi:MAG: 6-pyruvoyl trahydropterin synthase family protein [Candidatus Thorarchaeota archaeon]
MGLFEAGHVVATKDVHYLIRGHFHAAHFIPEVKKCSTVHGHTYRYEIKVKANTVMEFGWLKSKIDDVVAAYDHQLLGNKSVEELAEEIFDWLKVRDVPVVEVVVWETDRCGVCVRAKVR